MGQTSGKTGTGIGWQVTRAVGQALAGQVVWGQATGAGLGPQVGEARGGGI